MVLIDAGAIADCLELGFRDDPVYLLHHLKDLHSSTGDELFNDRVNKICKEKELCSNCFGDLIVETVEDPVGEYMGVPAKETIYVRKCSKCGRRFE